MIDYKVTCDGLPLLDASQDLLPESAVLDRRIADGMCEAEFSFTILPDHPHFSDIKPKKSVIRVTDNGREIFRGDVIPGKQGHGKTMTLTCQSHMKWLADVPDLWSMAGKSDQHPKGTVAEMFEAVFCEAADAEQPTGYNALAEPGREIYRGVCEINAEIDYCGSDSVYANLRRWIADGRGFARIARDPEDGLYYLHLTADSGGQSNTHRVTIGENVIDCAKQFDCGTLATGICPVGTDGGDRIPLTGTGDITGRTGYSVSLGAVWHGDSVTRYGRILRYREYPVDDVAAADRQQYLRETAADELAKLIRSSVTYEIRAVDERLTGGAGNGPSPGNYYQVDIPQTDGPQWLRLTRIVTDLMKPSGGKEYYGDDVTNLSGVMRTAKAARTAADAARTTASEANRTAAAARTMANAAQTTANAAQTTANAASAAAAAVTGDVSAAATAAANALSAAQQAASDAAAALTAAGAASSAAAAAQSDATAAGTAAANAASAASAAQTTASGAATAASNAASAAAAAQATANAAATPNDISAAIAASEAKYADYVVACGTTGIWTWRKWNSGVAECWGASALSVGANGLTKASNYDYYYKDGSENLPSNLFIAAPLVDAVAGNDGGSGNTYFWAGKHVNSTASVANYRVQRYSNITNATTLYVNLRVTGRWK